MEEGRRGIVEDSNVIFVAVGKELRNYRSTLRWVLQNAWGMEICVIYVHVPSQMIPVPTGGEVPASQLGEQNLADFREQERLEMVQTTDYYVDTIGNITGGNPTGISCNANSIEEGIVEVISLYRARRLVMGAATDTGYLREMAEATSTKAMYVHQHAPDFCQIQFICKGELISTREGVESSNPDVGRPPVVLGINEPDTGAGSSGNDDVYDQLEQAILKTGYSIRRQKTEIVKICQEYLAKRQCGIELEKNNALEEAEQLSKQLAQRPSTSSTPKPFSHFSTSEIENATNNFDASTKIGEGGYGYIYKGLLGHTEVAIKVPHTGGVQDSREFQREIDALSNFRHPNLVTLVGACLESRALIYGYLHGGNLEDRLNCKDKIPPLPWQTRIRIATELCSVVLFIHSKEPSIIHGDLKPANILLDENLVCKLSDFGICHLISRTEDNLTNKDTSFFTGIKGTRCYMDPEFFISGMLSRKSDVYSIGVILLQLLTGKRADDLANKVRRAWASDNNLNVILDQLAGEWPSNYAIELARMALLCCKMTIEDRPDLVEVLRFLKLIKAVCIGLPAHQVVSDDDPPTHFLCPIFQEIMEDPHFASDGFTYDKKAIEGWLELGRDSSPMTNMPLQDTNIVPNRALHSAIQEWLQQNDSL